LRFFFFFFFLFPTLYPNEHFWEFKLLEVSVARD